MSTLPHAFIQIQCGPHFTEELESRYFRYYCEDVAPQIAGPFKSSLWQRIVPQAAESEPFIKHAVVALGALSKSGSRSAPGLDSHHQYALSRYCMALKDMRQTVRSRAQDYRKVLIAGVLVFCFESVHGRQIAASAHASTVVKLLYELKHKQSSLTIPYPRLLLEDDLYSAISGLDLHALLFVDSRPAIFHQSLKADINVAIKHMPLAVDCPKQCLSFWQLIMRRNFHFIAAARATVQAYESLGDDASITAQKSAVLWPGNNIWSVSKSASKYIPCALLEEQDQCLVDIRRWELASAQLFSRTSQCCLQTEDFVVMTLLKIHAAMNVIMLAQTFFPPETVYDSYLPEFRTITRLSTSIQPLLVSSSSGAMFYFDVGIIPALAHVGVFCRNREVRGQAIQMLLSAPGYREGIWDSLASGNISDWTRRTEEKFLGEMEHVPGDRRVSLMSLSIALQEKTAEIAYKLGTGNGAGHSMTREMTLKW